MRERRRDERRRQRIPCELRVKGRSHQGFVLDLSAGGLYVQTSAAPDRSDVVEVRLRGEEGEAVELEARLARRYAVPRRLASVVRGGIGLRVIRAPERFHALAARRGRPEAEGGPAEEPPSERAGPAPEAHARRFRVRLRRSGSARSRVHEVVADSEEAAREAARRELGAEWEPLSATERPQRGGEEAR